MQTQKQYCGHWSGAELSRTLVAKDRLLDTLRRQIADLEQDMRFIRSEQADRVDSERGDND